jgi:hypothetical protein
MQQPRKPYLKSVRPNTYKLQYDIKNKYFIL